MIIVDTGAWVGLANRRDQYHVPCRTFFKHNTEPLITTCAVLVETTHLLFNRIGVAMTLAWLETIQAQGVVIAAPKPEDFPEMTRFMRQYADLPMDLADASLLLLAGQLGHGRIVSTDQGAQMGGHKWDTHVSL